MQSELSMQYQCIKPNRNSLVIDNSNHSTLNGVKRKDLGIEVLATRAESSTPCEVGFALYKVASDVLARSTALLNILNFLEASLVFLPN